jgi:hypothetical protein
MRYLFHDIDETIRPFSQMSAGRATMWAVIGLAAAMLILALGIGVLMADGRFTGASTHASNCRSPLALSQCGYALP